MGWVKEKIQLQSPTLQPTDHPVSGQAPQLAAIPGEVAKEGILISISS